MWGAVRAARLLDATPATVEVAVAANWFLSEFLPSLVIALALLLQVTPVRRAPVQESVPASRTVCNCRLPPAPLAAPRPRLALN